MIEIDIRSPEFRANPYPTLQAIREQAPAVQSSPRMGTMIAGYDNCDFVLRNNATFGRNPRSAMSKEEIAKLPPRPDILKPLNEIQQHFMLFNDPPNHSRIRSLVNKAFTPKMVQNLKASIEEIAENLMQKALPQGGMDLASEFSLPLPVTVIARMLGIPESDFLQFRQWSENFFGANDFFDPPADRLAKVVEANVALANYIRGLIPEKRSKPDEYLLSALIKAEEAGDKLNEAELIATVILLLIAGFETTTCLISNMVMLLLTHPEEWEKLKANPALVSGAVQETLRYEPPVFAAGRTVLLDTNFHGIKLERLSSVTVLMAAANRDPRKYSNPDTFDISRNEAKPLTFGGGIHYCLGAPLAMLEGEIAIKTIMRHVPNLQLVSDNFVWREMFVLRALETLPVVFS